MSDDTNIANTDLVFDGARSVDQNGYPLTFDLSSHPDDSMAVRWIAPNGDVNGWYISDAESPASFITNRILSTDFHSMMSYNSIDKVEFGNTLDTFQITADKLFLNGLNIGTDNSVTAVLGYKASTKEIVYTDASGTGAGWAAGYGEAHYNGSTTQSIANTFTVLNPMTAGDATGGWSWNTGTDQFTYTGDTEKYLIQFSFSAHCSTNTFDELTVSVRENSTETTARGQVECSNSGVTQSTSGSAIITANNGDTFDLGAYWTTSSSSNISIKHLNFIATKL